MSQFAQDASSENIPVAETSAPTCRICGNPVSVEIFKTDYRGMAIHEECYAMKVRLEQASQGGHLETTPPWKVLAEAISHEQDPKKMIELVAELNQALDKQIDGPARDATVGPDGK
jgi:hypothetical protein